MNDDDEKQKSSSAKPQDPTRSGEDFVGDTTGMTGVTTGKSAQTSATPDDTAKDQNKDHLPGGLTESGEAASPDKSGTERVSGAAMESMKEPGSTDPDAKPEQLIALHSNDDDKTLSQPYNEGEQSISGTTPDPESDDDTLANAQEAGTQLDEDEEHPKELDLGSDVDKAEAHHREN